MVDIFGTLQRFQIISIRANILLGNDHHSREEHSYHNLTVWALKGLSSVLWNLYALLPLWHFQAFLSYHPVVVGASALRVHKEFWVRSVVLQVVWYYRTLESELY